MATISRPSASQFCSVTSTASSLELLRRDQGEDQVAEQQCSNDEPSDVVSTHAARRSDSSYSDASASDSLSAPMTRSQKATNRAARAKQAMMIRTNAASAMKQLYAGPAVPNTPFAWPSRPCRGSSQLLNAASLLHRGVVTKV